MEIESEKPITLAQVEPLLKKRKKEGELRYEQKVSLNYAHKFSKLSVEKAKELVKELLDLGIVKVRREHAIKIADLLPEDRDDVRIIFAKERFSLKSEEIDQILKVVSKYQ